MAPAGARNARAWSLSRSPLHARLLAIVGAERFRIGARGEMRGAVTIKGGMAPRASAAPCDLRPAPSAIAQVGYRPTGRPAPPGIALITLEHRAPTLQPNGIARLRGASP